MMATTTSSVRYQRLLSVIEKALSQSKSQLDLEKVIKEIYGDDASIFGNDDDSDNNMLSSVIQSMLERVHDQVQESMTEHLQSQNVCQQLVKLEAILHKLEYEQASQQQADEKDKQSARQALEQSKLPKGIQPLDLVNYKAYQRMQQEREVLLNEITQTEKEIQEIKDRQQEQSQAMESRLTKIQQVGQELEKSADVCSMVS